MRRGAKEPEMRGEPQDTARADDVDRLLRTLADALGGAPPSGHRCVERSGSALVEVDFEDGRVLMVKRARYAEAAGHFDAARRAARLLRRRGRVVAPEYLEPDIASDDLPVHAYWRIARPTLERCWGTLPEAARPAAMRSWGELAGRMHEVRLPGHGALATAEWRASPLDAYLADALDRQFRASLVHLPVAAGEVVARLEAAVPAATARADSRGSLVHGDMTMSNVVCDVEDGRVRCVGVLDLETAFAGPPEADVARLAVLCGPLSRKLPRPLWRAFEAGYGHRLDALLLTFWRAWHLVNLAIFAVHQGWGAYADMLVDHAAAETDALGRIGGADRGREGGRSRAAGA